VILESARPIKKGSKQVFIILTLTISHFLTPLSLSPLATKTISFRKLLQLLRSSRSLGVLPHPLNSIIGLAKTDDFFRHQKPTVTRDKMADSAMEQLPLPTSLAEVESVSETDSMSWFCEPTDKEPIILSPICSSSVPSINQIPLRLSPRSKKYSSDCSGHQKDGSSHRA